jgi:hypothetical protein
MMEDTRMTHRLRHRIGRLEQGPQQQRVIVMSVAFAEQDRDDLVDEALAAAGVKARICWKSGTRMGCLRG